MELILMMILIGVAALSLIPVVKMNVVKDENKYRCLRYLVNAAFVWTILIFLERIVLNFQIVYYIHMLGFPLKFLLASFMICTVLNYTEVKMPRWILILMGIGVIGEFVLAFTNQFIPFLIDIEISSITSLDILYSAEKGWFFIYHLLVIYAMLISSIAYLFLYFFKHRNVRHYRSISITMGTSVAVVLLCNLAQLLFVQTSIDLTYVSIVITSFTMYQVIFKKDMIYNLKISGRGEILSNMREIYILTDESRNIVDISPLLLSKYDLDKFDFIGKPFNLLVDALKEKIVLYINYDVDERELDDKDHYHLREKKFSLHGFKDFGYMILLYDETQVYRLLRELNRLSFYDYMTGLHNRNFMENKLENLHSTISIGVVSLDLNGLKANNDYLGHDRGDTLLKGLANIIKQTMEPYADYFTARIGGDEFLIVIHNTDVESLKKIKESILHQCFNEDIEKTISVSIGIAFSEAEENIYALIRRADEDMYKMKQSMSKAYSMEIVEYAQKTGKYIR